MDADDVDLEYEGGAEAGGSGGVAGSGPNPDAGGDAHEPPIDGSIKDVSSDGTADVATLAPFVASPTAYFVHAAANLFPVRVCMEAAGTMLNEYPYPDDSPLPETNFPGIAPGGAVNIDALLAAADLQETVTLHLLKADHILVASATPGSTMNCDELVNTSALSSEHVVTFDDVDLRDLRMHAVRTLVVGGCLPDATLSEEVCGGGFDPTDGNLAIRSIGASPKLNMEPTSASIVPVHISPSLSAFQPDHSLELTYGRFGIENPFVLSADVPFETAPSFPGPFSAPSDLERFADTGFSLSKVGPGDRTVLLDASLAHVQQVTSPYEMPDTFFTGANGFFLVLVGDVSESEPWLLDGAWNPAYDGRGLHALALPFQFVMGDER